MSPSSIAPPAPPVRRSAAAFAVTAGLAAVLGTAALGGRGLLVRQAAQARELIGKPLGEDALAADRTFKKKQGRRIELLVLGDSVAAGLGAERPRDTLGARLARSLAKRTGRAVRLRTAAVVGSESSALLGQVAGLRPSYRPDVAVVVVGGNDVTHRVPVAESVAHLVACVEALQELGAEVVVGTCPDLGMLRPLRQPLRRLASRASRQLAAAQARAVAPLGATVVSLSEAVGHHFVREPDVMFSLDRFHPSSVGYKRTAQALVPHLEAALVRPRHEAGPTFALAGGEC
ncbi:SGNH/GDSL hydrolase family protein [Nocardioides aurantiacus]|uniref:Lysophospholipase L1-like esterase n=1 Tax=Nocardioides aurantiacus TaxID=86796 RepID=A0A3N2CYE6_9ACTN|nr:SGNH/GDSL hydrolase family protein [Nocardioides aurantiacus]ROR92458.1 lysophospholipase L1-like esterase [Nocardioides aurantiacus]